MQGLQQMLIQEQKRLEKIVMKVGNGLETAPEGYLRISSDKNYPRYYQCTNNKKGNYIPRSNKELPKLLAQKTYNKTVLKKAEGRLKQIKKYYRIIQMMKLRKSIPLCIRKGRYW